MTRRLTIAKSGVPVTLDPAYAQSCNELTIVGLAYEGLVRVEKENVKGENCIVPGLACNWEVNEAGTQWVFRLTHRKFSDGSMVTANSVIASLKRLRGLNSFARTRLKYIDSFDSPSETVIVINLASPNRNFLFELTAPYASIISPAGLMGEENSLSRTTYGSGDFQVTQFDDKHLVMCTHPHSPNYKDEAMVEFVFIEDSSERKLLLESDKVQLAENLSENDMRQLFKNPTINTISSRSALLTYIALNCRSGPFSDEKIRNLETIQRAPLETLRNYFHERPIRFLVDFPGEQSYWSDVARIIKADLEVVGIEVRIERVIFEEMRRKLNAGDFDITVIDWNLEYPDPSAVLDYWLHSDFVGLAGNASSYNNKIVDDLLESARTSNNEIAMFNLREAERIALSQSAYIPLVQRHFHFAVQPKARSIIRDDNFGWQCLQGHGVKSYFNENRY